MSARDKEAREHLRKMFIAGTKDPFKCFFLGVSLGSNVIELEGMIKRLIKLNRQENKGATEDATINILEITDRMKDNILKDSCAPSSNREQAVNIIDQIQRLINVHNFERASVKIFDLREPLMGRN